ncbi:MAG TPA: serine/threonine-protein kinase [Kofleriaceae bacterium]|nr:serine/threonine-protein kinase [Kofleriaceae bacterium]
MHLLHRNSSGETRQGRYVLGELLGRGGMAEVFAGQSIGSHGFQKPVAIKRLLPELANDSVFVERLIGEAKLLVGMQHGNVVSVLDLARDGDDVFLVMEFMDGPSVRQLLKARGARGLPIGVATYVVQMAATGLEFAHGRPGGAVIHADISPSNILLTTSGEVRVADFGIARREGNGAGVVEGKWAYMAPEQARGESLTPRSDVFALGVVLYELICGQHPLGRQVTADERESAPLHVIPPRVVKPSIPAGIEAICMRALAHDPSDRYASMQKFIDALVEERFANGWRDGSNDLAGVIREVTPGAGAPNSGPKTQHTDRPVTIVTRSLISQSAIKRKVASLSHPVHPLPEQPEFADGSVDVPPIHESGAQTRMLFVDPMIPPSLPAPRADGTPATPAMDAAAMPQQLLAMAASMLPSPELASVHGGNTFTGHSIAMERPSTSRWTFGVLGAAALIGAIAAVAIQVRSHDDEVDETPAITAPTTAPVNKLDFDHAPPPPTPQPPVAQPTVAQPATQPAATPDKPATDVTATTQPAAKSDDKPATLETRIANHRTHIATTGSAAKTTTKSPAKADAFIQVDEWNGEYAQARIGTQSHDGLPAKFYVAAGSYTLTIQNDNVEFTCRVTLTPGKALHVHVSLENRSCADH